MNFLNEKQTRRYFIFLAAFCALLMGCALLAGKIQAQGTKNVLLYRERAIASSLLLSGVAPEVIADAYGNGEITRQGVELLNKIGRSQNSDPRMLPAVRESAAAFLLFSASGACALSLLLLAGASVYLKRREKLYREAERIISEFADGDFSHHLGRDQEGTLYQMFNAADQLSMALQARGEAALQAREALREAVSDISHQLKTPIAAISMYTEIMLEDSENPEAVRRFAQKSMQSLERMEALIQTLLKVMRLDANSVSFEKSVCGVSELVACAIEELGTRAYQEGKKILTQGDPGEVLCCDFMWTVEAVSNLVKNALEHTTAGGTIRIGWQGSPVMLRLWVTDDGCGISQEDLPHIFKRFYRSKHSSDHQGAGLGLALTKAIVDGQGGTVSVVSREGEGTTFTISFLTQA